MTPTGLKRLSVLASFFGGKRPEPALWHQSDLLAFLAHLRWQPCTARQRAHTDQHDVCVFVMYSSKKGFP